MNTEKPQKYTLEEAYAEICRIRKDMGYDEFKTRQEREAYERGYRQAVIDLTTDFHNRSNMFLAINTTSHEH